ncbi:beta-1,3-galactosyltransferase 5-like isoform X3 [Macrobrachium rosenbergii]|uniref:beta-1,3-galactosyltransferase 5-like isoform X3 n=2 Tax=Macrobrachium rosenbergii TaxID=79674 RepID=UPI0034D3A3A2
MDTRRVNNRPGYKRQTFVKDTMRRLKLVLLSIAGATSVAIILLCGVLPTGPRFQQGYGTDFTHEFVHLYDNVSLTGPTVNSIPAGVEWLQDLSHLQICNKSDPFILAVVFSAIPNTQQRELIRNTWANPSYYKLTKIRAIFVLGATTNETLQQAVEEEITQYQDIIQYNFIDSYRNLTYKTIAWMTWVKYNCVDVPWIAKIDDDNVVNPFALNRYLVDRFKENPSPNAIHGRLRVTNKAMRNGKWVVTKEEYPPDKYPPFVLGPAYIVGRNAIDKLLEYTPYTPFLWLEDVYMTGLVAKAAGIKHVQAEKTLYTKKLSRRLFVGPVSFLIGASEKVKKTAWAGIIKYGPITKK